MSGIPEWATRSREVGQVFGLPGRVKDPPYSWSLAFFA